jgi:ERCC4-type nuclease
MSNPRHRIQVDHSERAAPLLELLRQSNDFEVQLARLTVGDYLIDDEVLIERKTVADFAASLVDGRLFPQAARLARDGRRSLVLIEGPPAASMPDVRPHAVQGALVSLAAMWRLPVLHTVDADDSLRVMRFLAAQVRAGRERVMCRYGRKPKRLASRRLFLLQGLPGVGPALAHGCCSSLDRSAVSSRRTSIRCSRSAASGRRKRRALWSFSGEAGSTRDRLHDVATSDIVWSQGLCVKSELESGSSNQP